MKGSQSFHESEIVIEPEEVVERRGRRGRPSADEQPTNTRTCYRVRFVHKANEDKLEEWLLRESVFILVTDNTIEGDLTDADLLEAYKGQQGVEGAFRIVKGPLAIAPIFLKTPSRIAALAFVYVLALMVHAQVRRVLLRSLKDNEETIAGNRGQTTRPSVEVLRKLLRGISCQTVETSEGQVVHYIDRLTTEQAKAFMLLGIEFWKDEGVVARIVEPGSGQRGYKAKGNGICNYARAIAKREMLKEQRRKLQFERPGKSKYKARTEEAI